MSSCSSSLGNLFGGLATTSAEADSFSDVAQIEIIPGWKTPHGTHMAGLRVTLQPGWKTYWRSPGDAGIPPQFSWAGSENLTGAEFHWPVPDLLPQSNIVTIGYKDSLVLPIELSPATAGEPISVSGEIHFGVCQDICLPVNLPFSAELPLEGKRDGAIVASLLNQPLSADEAGVTSAQCKITPLEDGLQVTATVLRQRALPRDASAPRSPTQPARRSPARQSRARLQRHQTQLMARRSTLGRPAPLAAKADP